MTREQLQRLRQLHATMNRLKLKRSRIMDSATKVTPALTGMPGSASVGDKVSAAAVKLTALEEAYQSALEELDKLTALAREEIDKITDTDMHAILYLRYVKGIGPMRIINMVHMSRTQVYRYLTIGENALVNLGRFGTVWDTLGL